MKKIITFGEVMGRLCPQGFNRFAQNMPGTLDFTFGGAESNVAGSIAHMGGEAAFVTALPDNALTDACVAQFKGLNIDTSHIQRTKQGRFGLYFLETGANQRPSHVIYDREHSAISLAAPESYPWEKIFAGAGWFHISGITPAISSRAAQASLLAVKTARQKGVTVSCDLNFRKKLWNWDAGMKPRELAEKTMRQILEYVDVVIANEEDASDVLSLKAENTDVHAGHLDISRFPEVAREIVRQFPKVSRVAITLRESISASHNNWGAMLYSKLEDRANFAPWREGEYRPYEIRNIVDRVGGGDSFAAGLVFALNTPELSGSQDAIEYAVAASCLAHSILGDLNYSTRKEVEALMRGSGSGRVVR